ncbi:putative ribonuclease H-like domain-containing protein [Tanacetum coccineum]
MYSFDLKDVVPSGDLTCLFAKATIDESNLWHRRLGHINFINMNKLVRGNLVRGLPSKLFENYHTCVACQKGTGPNWMFDIDTLTMSMNYQPVFVGNQTNGNADEEVADDAGKKNGVEDPTKEGRAREQRNEFESLFGQDKDANNAYTVFTLVNAATPSNTDYPTNLLMPDLEDTANLQDTGIFGNAYDDEDVGAEADINNLETTMNVSPIATTRIHKDHPKDQIIGEVHSAVQTRRMVKQSEAGLITFINKQRRTNHKDFQNCRSYAGRASPVQAIKCLDTGGFTLWIEAIRLFLAYASFMDFTVYQMDVKSAFLYGTIEEEISSIGELTFFLGLQVKQRKDGIFLSQDKYVYDILKKFGFSSVKTTSTLMETHKPLSKDADGTDVDIQLYISMIGSLMYLTSSRPDIMFAVCACSRFQVQPKASHMHAVKRIFIYLKGQPTLGLWYPKDSPIYLIAYSDSDYAGASLDRKSTT